MNKMYYFDITEHGWQVMGSSSQAEVVENVIFQCIQVWVVHTNRAIAEKRKDFNSLNLFIKI